MTTTFATVGPFLVLFGLLYAGFGVASPFLPSLMEARGIPAEQIDFGWWYPRIGLPDRKLSPATIELKNSLWSSINNGLRRIFN
jgi:hypothetical protein